MRYEGKMLVFWSKYRVVTPYFDHHAKIKPCYEGLKQIRVDVDEI